MAMEREISILVFQQFSRLGPWIRIFFDLKNHCLAAARGIEDNIQMLGFYSEEKPYIDLVPWLGLKRNLKGKSWEIIKGHRKSWCHVWMEKKRPVLQGETTFWYPIWYLDTWDPTLPHAALLVYWALESKCWSRCKWRHSTRLPRPPHRLAPENTERLAKTCQDCSWLMVNTGSYTIRLHMPTRQHPYPGGYPVELEYINAVKAPNWYLWWLTPIHGVIETS